MGEEEVGKLFIGGVDKAANQEDFQSLFESKGAIEDIILMKDPQMPDRNRGFGFVKFKDPACAEKILNGNEPLILNGKALDVKPCRQRDSQAKHEDGAQPDSPNKIFVGGLPQSCNEDTLKSTFSEYGEVQHVKIMKDRDTGNLRGFGFVTFASAEAVEKLVRLHFVPCDGKNVEVKAAEHRYRFQGPEGGNPGSGAGFGAYGGAQTAGYSAGSNWQQGQAGQGDSYGYNNAGWGGQQQMGGLWGQQQQPQMGNYGNQQAYGRGQGANQWSQQPNYGAAYGGAQPSGGFGGGYAQSQGYGDQYSQGTAYAANQQYSGGYGGGYGTSQPQQAGYSAQAPASYNAQQGSYGGGYSAASTNYGQTAPAAQAVADPNSSGGPMRSGYGQRVNNNAHGFHPYGK